MATDCRHSGKGAILCEDAGGGEACCSLHTLRRSMQTKWGLAPWGEQRPASGRGDSAWDLSCWAWRPAALRGSQQGKNEGQNKGI